MNITPLARRLAEENNLDWQTLEGSGDGGRIMERDVLQKLADIMSRPEPTRVIDLGKILGR